MYVHPSLTKTTTATATAVTVEAAVVAVAVAAAAKTVFLYYKNELKTRKSLYCPVPFKIDLETPNRCL